MLIKILTQLQEMQYVEQDSSDWHLQGNAFCKDQSKGWGPNSTEGYGRGQDHTTTSTTFVFSFVSFCCHRESRERPIREF